MRCRFLACLAACAMLVIGLASCSSPVDPGPVITDTSPVITDTSPVPTDTSPVTTDTSPADGGSGAVTGTVSWPDGTPAANVKVYFVDGDYHIDTYQPDQTVQLGADASYSTDLCPCQNLTAYLFLPGQGGTSVDCWILMQAQNTYSGITASPGDAVNWQALDMPCDWQGPYPSDQSSVQTEATALDPNQGGNYSSGNGGSWQDAQSRANAT